MNHVLRAADALTHIRALGRVPSDAELSAHLACTEAQARAARLLLENRGLIQKERMAA